MLRFFLVTSIFLAVTLCGINAGRCSMEGLHDQTIDPNAMSSLEETITLALEDYYATQQISPECFEHITTTLQAFVSIVFDCAVTPRAESCINSIIELLSDLILMPTICQVEEEID